eukprot:TRINITY_DN2915_c0_g2_i3.p1 TRINITY_DN2915_c0_g2~~TRINITY_DN2915_c0_g2_i3.p1  ORF type:complete len:5220 (-),score=1332.45 TRINITY_DN2915_c0_g2_i3:434-16093(-)
MNGAQSTVSGAPYQVTAQSSNFITTFVLKDQFGNDLPNWAHATNNWSQKGNRWINCAAQGKSYVCQVDGKTAFSDTSYWMKFGTQKVTNNNIPLEIRPDSPAPNKFQYISDSFTTGYSNSWDNDGSELFNVRPRDQFENYMWSSTYAGTPAQAGCSVSYDLGSGRVAGGSLQYDGWDNDSDKKYWNLQVTHTLAGNYKITMECGSNVIISGLNGLQYSRPPGVPDITKPVIEWGDSFTTLSTGNNRVQSSSWKVKVSWKDQWNNPNAVWPSHGKCVRLYYSRDAGGDTGYRTGSFSSYYEQGQSQNGNRYRDFLKNLTPTKTGAYTLTVRTKENCGGSWDTRASGSFTMIPGTFDKDNTRIESYNTAFNAGVAQSYSFVFRDAWGNVLTSGTSGGSTTVKISLDTTHVVQTTTTAVGTKTISMFGAGVATVAGSYTLLATIGGVNVNSNNDYALSRTITINHLGISRANCIIKTADSDVGDGVATTGRKIVILERDQYNNLRVNAGTAATFTISTSLPNPTPILNWSGDSNKGTRTYTYDTTIKGSYQLNVRYNGNTIGSKTSHYRASFTISPASYNRGKSSLGSVPTQGLAGVGLVVTGQLRDVYNNKLDSVPSFGFTAIMSKTGKEYLQSPTHQGEGALSTTLTPLIKGTYSVRIRQNNDNSKNIGNTASNYIVKPNVLNAGVSRYLNPPSEVVAGVTITWDIQAKDQYGNTLETHEDTSSWVVEVSPSGSVTASVASVGAASAGKYQVSFRANQARNYVVKVKRGTSYFDSTRSTGIDITVKPDVIHTKSFIKSINGGDHLTGLAGTQEVLLQARDQFDNDIGKYITADYNQITATAAFNGGGDVAANVVNNAGNGGDYKITYSATKTGPYLVKVKVGGSEVTGSSYTNQISPNVVSPAVSLVYDFAPTVVAGNNGTDTLITYKIQLRDQYDNNRLVSNEQGKLSVKLTKTGETDITGSVSPISGGLYEGRYQVTIIGTWQLKTKFDGTRISSSYKNILVHPFLTEPTKCIASGPGLTASVAGTTNTFNVQARDKYDNVRTSFGDSFSFVFTHAVHGAQTPNPLTTVPIGVPADSTYQVTYQVTISGDYSIAIQTKGTSIKSSPFDHFTKTAVINAAKTTASGAGLGGTQVAGITSTFDIQARDIYENLRTETTDNLVLTMPHKTLGSVSANDLDIIKLIPPTNGKYLGTYRPTLTGSYDIFVKVGGSNIASMPYQRAVTPAATAPAECTATGSGLGTQIAGTDSTFEIQARDQFTNTRTKTDDVITVTLTSAGVVVNGQVTPMNPSTDGKYLVRYNTTIRGTYSMVVRIGGQDAVKINRDILVKPSVVHPPLSSVTGSGLTTTTAGVATTLTIWGRDSFNNRLSTSPDQWTVLIKQGGITVTGVTTPVAGTGGTYSTTYTATISGTYTVTVTEKLTNTHVLGSPSTLTVNPAATDPAQTIASGTNLAVSEAGIEGTFNVQARDQFQNNRWDQTDNLIVTLHHKIWTLPQINGIVDSTSKPLGQGSYRVRFTTTVSGNYNLQIKVGTSQTSGSPRNLLTNPTVTYPARTTTSGPGLGTTVAGTDQPQFLIQARDVWNNNRTLTTDTWKINVNHVYREDQNLSASVSVLSTPLGQYWARFNATVAGDYKVFISSQNILTSNSPQTMTVIPNSVFVPNCYAIGIPLATAPINQFSYIDVYSRDAYFNPRYNVSDTFTFTLKNPTNQAVTITQVAQLDNKYTARFKPLVNGNHTLSIQFNGVHIPGSPFTVEVLEPVLTRITPNLGQVPGGTKITIYGGDFVESSFLRGKVNGVECTATQFVSRTMAVCTSPATDMPRNTTVRISNNAIDYSAGAADYHYYTPETVASFDPIVGPVYGRTLVTIIGTGFIHNEYLQCSFGPAWGKKPVLHISPTKIICESPDHEVGEFNLYVSNNHQQLVTTTSQTWRFLQPFSPLCRVPTELSVAVQDRLKAGAEYHDNLATVQSVVTTSALYGVAQLPSGLVDGDRCCSENKTNNAFVCGTNFKQLSSSELAFVEFTLAREAFVNEFIMVWYRPCRNQPNYYEIDMWQESTLTWTNIIKRRTKLTGPQEVAQRPCYVIPSDIDKVSLCVDYIPDVRGTKFRVRFNNSEANMGTLGFSTDGGWLYETEAHGVFTDTPEHLVFTTPVSDVSIQSRVNSPIQTVLINTQNHHFEDLFANDTETTQLKFRVFDITDKREPPQDLRSNLVGGPYPIAFTGGRANMSSNYLIRPPTGNYTFQFYTDNVPLGLNITFGVIIGPAYQLHISSIANATLISLETVNLPVVKLHAVDAGNNFVGITDTDSLVVANSSVTILSGQETMIDGNVTFSTMTMHRPPRGDYIITFSRSGLVSTSYNFTIGDGPAYELLVETAFTPTGFESKVDTPFNPVTIKIVDAGGDLIIVNANTIQVTVQSGNGSLSLLGQLSSWNVGPRVTFNNIRAWRPVVGDHTARFFVSGSTVKNITAPIKINIGPPDFLSVGVTPTLVYPSLKKTLFSLFKIYAYDASSAFVNTADNVLRSVSVSLDANTTAVFGNVLKGTTTVNMTNGQSEFSTLRFDSPIIGFYTLVFTSSSAEINATTVTIQIIPGPAELIEITSTHQIDIESALTVQLPTVNLRLLDAGREFVGSLDTQNRTVNATLENTEGILQVPGSVAFAVNGSTSFDALKLVVPSFGLFNLTFSSTGLESFSIVVNVSTGEPLYLEASQSFAGSYPAMEYTHLNDISIRAVDAARSLVRTSKLTGRTIRLAAINGSAQVVEFFTLSMTAPIMTFKNITLVRPTAQIYQLIFASQSLSNASVTTTIVFGAPYRIQIDNAGGSTYPTDNLVVLDTITAKLFDIGSNFLIDNNGTRVSVRITRTSGAAEFTADSTVSTLPVNGWITLSALKMSKPANDTYTVTLYGTDTNLVNATSTKLITTGRALHLNVWTPASIHVRSALQVSLPDVDIRCRDADLNTIESPFFVANRTVSVSINSTLSDRFIGTLTKQTPGAYVKFDNMTLLSPPIGDYSLLFVSNDALASIRLFVNVSIGEPVYLDVISPVSKSFTAKTVATFNLPTVQVRALDAGRTFVGSVDAQTRPTTINCTSCPSSVVLNGNRTQSMAIGNVAFPQLFFNRPPNATHTLEISSAGLFSDFFTVVIETGLPHELRVVKEYRSTPHESVDHVQLDDVEIHTYDIGGGFTPLTQPGQTVYATLTSNTDKSSLGGNMSCVFVAGRCLFTNLQLNAPVLSTYRITFSSEATLNVNITVNITAGPAKFLSLDKTVVHVRSQVNTPQEPIHMLLRDAGRNIVGSKDPQLRGMTLTNFNSTVLTKVGPSFFIIEDGATNITGISFTRPKVGLYVFRLSAINLQSIQFRVNISVGDPTQLVVIGTNQFVIPVKQQQGLPNVLVHALDAGSTFVGRDDHDILSVQMGQPSFAFLGGNLTVAMQFGQVLFGNVLAYAAPIGSYVVQIGSAGLVNTTIRLNVTIGEPVSLDLVLDGGGEYQTDKSVRLNRTRIRALDYGGNFVGSSDTVTRSVTAYVSNTTMNIKGTQANMVNGMVDFDNLEFSAAPYGEYTLLFHSPTLSNVSISVTVVEGPAYDLDNDGYTGGSHPSAISVTIADTVVYGRSASTEVTSVLPFGVNGTVTIGRAAGTPTSVALPQFVTGAPFAFEEDREGTVSVSQYKLIRPKKGIFELVVNVGSLTPTKFNVEIVTGPPENLQVTAPKTVIYQAAALTSTRQFLVEEYDAGYNRVGDLDTAVRQLSADLLNISLSNLTDINRVVDMVNGSALVPSLQFVEPRASKYTLLFSLQGLKSVTTEIRIAIGVATQLKIHSPDPSSALSCIGGYQAHINGSVVIRLYDGGHNRVTNSDVAARSMSAYVVQSTGAQNTTFYDLPFVSLIAGDRQIMPAQTGQVTFSGMVFSQPKNGIHVIRFSHRLSGVDRLTPVDMSISVTAGPPIRLVLFNGTVAREIKYGGGGLARVYMGEPIHTEMLDAGGNRAKVDYPRTVVARNGTLNPRDPGLQVLPIFRAGATSHLASTPLFSISGMWLTPIAGRYEIKIESSGLIGFSLFYTVIHGPPAKLYSNTSFPLLNTNVGAMKETPIVYVVDDQDNFVLRSDVMVVITMTPTQVGNMDGSIQRTINGVANFTGLTFKGIHGQSYGMVFNAYVPQGSGDVLPLNVSHAVDIISCLNVKKDTVPSKIGIVCVCRRGYISAGPLFPCEPCPNGEYQEEIGQALCDKCPLFMDTKRQEGSDERTDCECVTGHYRLTTESETCLRCPEGAACNQGEFIRPVNGFYRFLDGSDEVFQCPNDLACNGGPNSTCSKGYTGPLCSVCEEGYGPFGKTCLECGDTSSTGFLVFLIILFVLVFFVVVIRSASGEKSDASIVLKILLNYVQVVAFLGEFRVNWSREMQTMFEVYSVSLVSLNLHPLECSFKVSYYDRFYAYMTFPLWVMILPAIGLYLHYLFTVYVLPNFGKDWRTNEKWTAGGAISVAMETTKERIRKLEMLDEKLQERTATGTRSRARALSFRENISRKIRKKTGISLDEVRTYFDQKEDMMMVNLKRWYVDMYVVSLLVTVFLSHPSVSRVTLQAFNCAKFSEEDLYLVEDMSISCLSPEYLLFRDTAATIMLVVYCLGVVVGSTYLLIRNRFRLHEERVLQRYRFLYDGYANKRFFWEMIIMMRKMLIVTVIVFARRKPLMQLYGGLWLIMGSLVAHLYGRPFVLPMATNLESASLMATAVTLLSGMLFYQASELNPLGSDMMSWCLIVFNAIVVLVFLAVLAKMVKRAALNRKKQIEMRKMLAKHLDEVVELEFLQEKRRRIKQNPEYEKKTLRRKAVEMTLADGLKKAETPTTKPKWVVEAQQPVEEQPKQLTWKESVLEQWEDNNNTFESKLIRDIFVAYMEKHFGDSDLEFLHDVCKFRDMFADDPLTKGTVAVDEVQCKEHAHYILEKYLDDDSDDYLEEADFGFITSVSLAVDEGRVIVSLFDQLAVEHFNQQIEEARTNFEDMAEELEEESEMVQQTVEAYDYAQPLPEALEMMSRWNGRQDILDDKEIAVAFVGFLKSDDAHEKNIQFLLDVLQYRSAVLTGTSKDEIVAMANLIAESYLDDESDEYLISTDFGVIMKTMLAVDSGKLTETLFDELTFKYFGEEMDAALEHFKENPNDTIRGIKSLEATVSKGNIDEMDDDEIKELVEQQAPKGRSRAQSVKYVQRLGVAELKGEKNIQSHIGELKKNIRSIEKEIHGSKK